MAFLNYTTTIAAEKTVGEIQRKLASSGASALMIRYENRRPAALEFAFVTRFGERGFELPARVAGVYAILNKQWERGLVPHRFVTYDQAERIAWRVVKVWLDAQLAILETGMVELERVFLPYMKTPSGATVYDEMARAGFVSSLGLPAAGETAGADAAAGPRG